MLPLWEYPMKNILMNNWDKLSIIFTLSLKHQRKNIINIDNDKIYNLSPSKLLP